MLFSQSLILCLCLKTVKEPQNNKKRLDLRDDEIVAIDIRKAVHNLSNTEILL